MPAFQLHAVGLYKSICFIFCLSPAWWLLRSDKTRSHPELGRQTLQRRWYYVSRPGRVGRCQACQGQKISSSECSLLSGSRSESRFVFGAGWSSPVARQAHNLKVTGSNPVPATTQHTSTHHKPPALRARGFLAFEPCAAGARPGHDRRRDREGRAVRAEDAAAPAREWRACSAVRS